MSSEAEGVVEEERCASCGITQGDDIKLMLCTACKLARYCSVACQKEHRPKHKRECKRRVAELRDELLFKQPESTHEGDCPICLLPQPLDGNKSTTMMCCFTLLCRGCALANERREIRESLKHKCPFCRHSIPKSQADIDRCLKKRVESNCPAALRWVGDECSSKGDFDSALKYYTKAAGLKDAQAHYELSQMYFEGLCVEKNVKMEKYHLEEAAIGGHFDARYNLGVSEGDAGNIERAKKHHIIAASQGVDEAVDVLKKGYFVGQVSKDDYAAALRAHQAAVDATKSPQREAAESAQYIAF
mmetsp:Transcript_18123/g.28441  ORF Transcript_18123/g.28441 Transcript_18123/m.28441 type:complete len:302 (+) Transcript_18123:183-1088(+)